jgi:hypothetical protein
MCTTGFLGLRLSLMASQICVRLLRLIAQNVAKGFNLTSGARVGVRASRAVDMSRGSPTGLDIR